MSKSSKIIVVAGCTVLGLLNGLTLIEPSSAATFAKLSIAVAMIIAALTGVTPTEDS